MFLNIHWHPKPKEFFKCYDYFFKAPLTGHGHSSPSLKIAKMARLNPCMKSEKKGSYYFFWTAKKVPLSGFIQNMYQASSKWWNKWIKMDKLDFFKNHNIKKKLSVLAFYEYLKYWKAKLEDASSFMLKDSEIIVWPCSRTMDARWGNHLPCTAKNLIPIPNL